MSHLRIQNLRKSYGSHLILKGISFEVGKGEFVSLLGPSGCGKTTTLRCIAGLERPDSDAGDIRLADRVFSSGAQFIEPEKRHLGMVFQSYAVWPHMSVFENVAFPLRLDKKLSRAEADRKVQESLDRVRLRGYEKRFPHELSGGQQQRVALARALAMSPSLLLLDEPLSNLDVLLRDELRGELRRLTQQLDLTTILVTHDQKEALSLSDRIVVLNGGAIEAIGTPEQLYANPPSAFTAEFLAQGQTLKHKNGKAISLVPRRWTQTQSGGILARVVARLYLGNEYEYLAESDELTEPLRFFSTAKLESGTSLRLKYDGLFN